MIREAIHLLASDTSASGLRSVQLLEEPPSKCFYMKGGLLTPLMDWEDTEKPAQSFRGEWKEVWKPNGYVDICRGQLPVGVSPWGEQVLGYVTPRQIEIDEPDDLKWAHYLYPFFFPSEESRWPKGRG